MGILVERTKPKDTHQNRQQFVEGIIRHYFLSFVLDEEVCTSELTNLKQISRRTKESLIECQFLFDTEYQAFVMCPDEFQVEQMLS